MNIDWHSAELTRMTVVDENDKMPKTCAAFWLHSAESVSGSIGILRPGYAMTFPKTWERWWMNGSAERLADTHHLLIPYPFCIRLCAGTVYVRTRCQRVKITPSRHTRRLFYCGFTAPNLTG